MLEQGIIEERSSPWMAPTVFVKKKSRELRICVDYRELNKNTKRDAYPLPLPDEVQNRLAGATIFTTLDLQCGYWQVPINPEDRAKTAFCPGPDMGLFQFCQSHRCSKYISENDEQDFVWATIRHCLC